MGFIRAGRSKRDRALNPYRLGMQTLAGIFGVWLIGCSLFWMAGIASAASSSPYGVYVQDDAGVLSAEYEQRLYDHALWLHEKTGSAQVGVATVNAADLKGKSIENAAVDRFRQMGLGSKERNDGVLLLYVSGDEPHVRIEVGYGLEGRITDSKAGAILDRFFVPLMQQGQLDEACFQTQSALIREAAAEYGIDASQLPEGSGGLPPVDEEGGGGWFNTLPGYLKVGIGIIVVLLFFLDFKLTGGAFTFAVLNMVGRRGGSSGGRGGFGGGRGGGGSSGGGGASR
ncbi:TPM domain-containing protein [Paenibacillus solisilvae]|uniref:TPM domain-containing protein n=1 Tax=Paenibacillus solisilvae TaxID=2486751 RepID=A0ABW0VVD9_9BACL